MAGAERRCFVVVARWLVPTSELFAAVSKVLAAESGSVRLLDDSDAVGAIVLMDRYGVGSADSCCD
jgi:hypothetical protein